MPMKSFAVMVAMVISSIQASANTSFGFAKCEGVVNARVHQDAIPTSAYSSNPADLQAAIQATVDRNAEVNRLAGLAPLVAFAKVALAPESVLNVVDPVLNAPALTQTYSIQSTSGTLSGESSIVFNGGLVTSSGFVPFVQDLLLTAAIHSTELFISAADLQAQGLVVNSSALGLNGGVFEGLEINRVTLRSGTPEQRLDSSATLLFVNTDGTLVEVSAFDFQCAHGVTAGVVKSF